MENKLKNPSHQPFILAEIREREMFTYFCSHRKDFEITQMSDIASYRKWDAAIISADTEYLCEVKTRDWMMDDFGDWILEQMKYDALKDVQKRMYEQRGRHLTILYINIFNDGVLIWNLDKIELNFHVRESKMTQHGNRNKITKQVANLNASAATRYDLNINFDFFNDVSAEKFKLLYPNEESYITIPRNIRTVNL